MDKNKENILGIPNTRKPGPADVRAIRKEVNQILRLSKLVEVGGPLNTVSEDSRRSHYANTHTKYTQSIHKKRRRVESGPGENLGREKKKKKKERKKEGGMEEEPNSNTKQTGLS